MWFPDDEGDGEQTDTEGVPVQAAGCQLRQFKGATAAGAETAVSVHASLDAWHRALVGTKASTAAESPVMPMGFGGNESVEHEAWLGDKYLGCAVAKVLVARGAKGKDNLTRSRPQRARQQCQSGEAIGRRAPRAHAETTPAARPPRTTAS